MAATFRILSVTWSADKAHFGLLRDSLTQSALAGLPHDVVVQTEDLPLFEEFRGPTVSLYTTSDLLPATIERRRLLARRWQGSVGRRGSTLLGSMTRRVGYPAWPRYTGWHTQQLCKLAYVASSDTSTVVIMDSDVVVTEHARPEDFVSPEGIVCFSEWVELSKVKGKVRNWQVTAHRLFDQTMSGKQALDCFFDTPFVMDRQVVREMIQWLEKRYSGRWWDVLSAQPPRRWSEFSLYKLFLRDFSPLPVKECGTDKLGYLFDAGNPVQLLDNFIELVQVEQRHYITIHSQSAGRQKWTAEAYADRVRSCLARGEHK